MTDFFLFDEDGQRFAGAITAWSPATLGSALKAWWNADDTSDGTPASWTDRKASLAPTVASTPVSAATSFNGVARGITFDGVDDCFAGTTLTGLPAGATAGEIWALVDQTISAVTAGTAYVFKYGGAGTNARAVFRNGSSNSKSVPAVGDGTTILNGTVVDFTGPHIIGGRWNGTTEYGRIDGQDMTPASATITTINTGAVRLRIGSNNTAGAANLFKGVIRHILVTTELTLGQRQQLEGWLAWDGGVQSRLPASHPFKSERP